MKAELSQKTQEKFTNIPITKDWSFADKTIKDTSYITHSYYTYPAKFIPQLASRLINDYSVEGELVFDPFLGSGTTVVEAIVNERRGVGTDINPVAHLVAQVKSTPIEIAKLNSELSKIAIDLHSWTNGDKAKQLKEAEKIIPSNERIDYWYKEHQKELLTLLLYRIRQVKEEDIQNFFIVGFAQILKTCSIWMQKSVKPTRDLKKKDYEPIELFLKKSNLMIKRHTEFNSLLSKKTKENIDIFRNVICADSRTDLLRDNEVDLVVTSPPYVTSYEYGDLHQLPALWLGFTETITEFRKDFIGSAYKEFNCRELNSELAENIVNNFGSSKKGLEVKTYFSDMLETFIELKRIVKKGGKVCIVIGNTKLKGVDIFNAEVFEEQLNNIGFSTYKIIKREIPSKMLPSTRDNSTGRFTKTSNSKKTLAYPTEFILIMEKI